MWNNIVKYLLLTFICHENMSHVSVCSSAMSTLDIYLLLRNWARNAFEINYWSKTEIRILSNVWKVVPYLRKPFVGHFNRIIISKSYAHVSTNKVLKALIYVSQRDRLLKLWILRPNYVAAYKGLQGAKAHTAATAWNTGANSFSFQ